MSSVRRILVALALVVALAGTVFVPSSAEAVSVHRTDAWIERAIQQIEVQFQEYLKSIVYSLTNLRSLDDLAKLPDRLKNMTKNFDLDNMLGRATQSLTRGAMNDLGKLMSDSLYIGNSRINITDLIRGGDIAAKIKQAGVGAGSDMINDALGDLFDDFNGALSSGTAPSSWGKDSLDDWSDARQHIGGWGLPGDAAGSGTTTGGSSIGAGVPVSSAGAKSAATGIVKEFTETYQMTMPGAQQAAAQMILSGARNEREKEGLVLNLVEKQRAPIISKIAGALANYEGQKDSEGKVTEKSPFEKQLEKFMDANQELAESAKTEVERLNDPGKAEQVIGTLLATQAQQLALQNSILVMTNKALADEIHLMGAMSMMGVEQYAQSTAAGIDKQIDMFRRAVGSVTH
jgi:hypothetical protein